MQTTTNIGLKTYEASDPTDWLGEFNYNMNKIDQAVGSQNDQIEVIEETASTAVTTANSAVTTATEALTTANSKTSIDDLVSSDSTTYSSDKIDDLISEIQPGTEIDDTITSTDKTWSSSKINSEIDAVETIANGKASINDTTASASTTYSSNKIDQLIEGVDESFPDYGNNTVVATDSTSGSNHLAVMYTATEDCYLYIKGSFTPTSNGYVYIQLFTNSRSASLTLPYENRSNVRTSSPIYKVKSGTEISAEVTDLNTTSNNKLEIYKVPIIN